MWRHIDKEMDLKNCSIYCYLPEEDPYDGEEGAIWSFNYFFYNKTRKRVCYLYLRGLSAISHDSGQKTPVKAKRGAEVEWSLDEPTSSKRARYWLGDRAVNATSAWADDDDELEELDVTSHDGPFVDHRKEQQVGTAHDEQTARSSADSTSPSTFDTASPESIRRSPSKNTTRDVSEEPAIA